MWTAACCDLASPDSHHPAWQTFLHSVRFLLSRLIAVLFLLLPPAFPAGLVLQVDGEARGADRVCGGERHLPQADVAATGLLLLVQRRPHRHQEEEVSSGRGDRKTLGPCTLPDESERDACCDSSKVKAQPRSSGFGVCECGLELSGDFILSSSPPCLNLSWEIHLSNRYFCPCCKESETYTQERQNNCLSHSLSGALRGIFLKG